MKPISREQISDVLETAFRIIKRKNEKFEFQQGKEYIYIPLGEIAYFGSEGIKVKEGAWRFIEEFLIQEKSESYYDNIFTFSFPTLKRILNEKVEAAIKADSQQESERFPEQIYSDGSTFQFHALTWDDVNVMLDLIPYAKPCFNAEGDEINRIINEEASGYYSGQRGAEDTAGTIQNRV